MKTSTSDRDSLEYIREPDGSVRPPRDSTEWSAWFKSANRQVRDTTIGDIRISTVFLGIDNEWGEGPPVLWETMVFGGVLDQEQMRYTSEADAIEGHEAMVARVKLAEKGET